MIGSCATSWRFAALKSSWGHVISRAKGNCESQYNVTSESKVAELHGWCQQLCRVPNFVLARLHSALGTAPQQCRGGFRTRFGSSQPVCVCEQACLWNSCF
jgi:hypothetical protein